MSVIALDVGGTFIKFGLFQNGKIIEKGEVSTPKDSADEFYQVIAKLIENRKDGLTGIAVSLPGFINPKTQVAVRAGALGYLSGDNIGEEIEKYIKVNVPIYVENDANCAAIAEKLAGNAQDVHDFIVVTLGTGVGGAIYVNNRLIHGKNFSTGEFGMMVTDYSKFGFATLHEFASTKALCDEYARKKGYPIGSVEGYQVMSEVDDPIVKKIVEAWGMRVAICLYNLIVTLDPQRILLGGGISKNKDILPLVKKSLAKVSNYSDFATDIENCKFYNDAGLYGAYWAFKNAESVKLNATTK